MAGKRPGPIRDRNFFGQCDYAATPFTIYPYETTDRLGTGNASVAQPTTKWAVGKT